MNSHYFNREWVQEVALNNVRATVQKMNINLAIQRIGSREEPIALVVSALTSINAIKGMLSGAFAISALRMRLIFDDVVLEGDTLLSNVRGLSSGSLLYLLVLRGDAGPPSPLSTAVGRVVATAPPPLVTASVHLSSLSRSAPLPPSEAFDEDSEGLATATFVTSASPRSPVPIVTVLPVDELLESDGTIVQLPQTAFAFPSGGGVGGAENTAIPVAVVTAAPIPMSMRALGIDPLADLPEGVAVTMEELEALGQSYATATRAERAHQLSMPPPALLGKRRWGDAPSVTRSCHVPLFPFLPKMVLELFAYFFFSIVIMYIFNANLLTDLGAVAKGAARGVDSFWLVGCVMALGCATLFLWIFGIPSFMSRPNSTVQLRLDAAAQSIRIDHWIMGLHSCDQLYPCCTPRKTMTVRFREIRLFAVTPSPVRVPPCLYRCCGFLPCCDAGGCETANVGAAGGIADGGNAAGRRNDLDLQERHANGTNERGVLCQRYTLSLRKSDGSDAPLFWGTLGRVAKMQSAWEAYLGSLGWPTNLDRDGLVRMRVDRGPPPVVCTLGRMMPCRGSRNSTLAESGDAIVYWQWSTQRKRLCRLLSVHFVGCISAAVFTVLLWRENWNVMRLITFEVGFLEGAASCVAIGVTLAAAFFSFFFANRMEMVATRWGISTVASRSWRSPWAFALLSGMPLVTCTRQPLFHIDINTIVDVECRSVAFVVGRRASVQLRQAVLVVNNIVTHGVDRYVCASSAHVDADRITDEWVEDLKDFLRGRGAPIVGLRW
jgi:hypothetical protein